MTEHDPEAPEVPETPPAAGAEAPPTSRRAVAEERRRRRLMRRLFVATPYVVLLILAGALLRATWYTHEALPELAPPPDWGPLAQPAIERGPGIRGQVIDAAGRGVANAMVAAVRGERFFFVHAGDDGRFLMPEVPAGPLVVDVIAEGYPPVALETSAGTVPVELRLDEAEPEPPRFSELSASLLEGVVLSSSASELEGYELVLTPEVAPTSPTAVSPTVTRRVRVLRAGAFEVPDLVHGRYRVSLLPPWASGGDWPDLLRGLDEPPRLVTHSAADPSAQLVLETRTGSVEQELTAPPVPGREQESPVHGATIFVRARPDDPGAGQRPGLLPLAQSNEQGRYRVGDLPEGTYEVLVRAGEHERSTTVRIRAGETRDLGRGALSGDL